LKRSDDRIRYTRVRGRGEEQFFKTEQEIRRDPRIKRKEKGFYLVSKHGVMIGVWRGFVGRKIDQ
jgi:hypothetical protein